MSSPSNEKVPSVVHGILNPLYYLGNGPPNIQDGNRRRNAVFQLQYGNDYYIIWMLPDCRLGEMSICTLLTAWFKSVEQIIQCIIYRITIFLWWNYSQKQNNYQRDPLTSNCLPCKKGLTQQKTNFNHWAFSQPVLEPRFQLLIPMFAPTVSCGLALFPSSKLVAVLMPYDSSIYKCSLGSAASENSGSCIFVVQIRTLSWDLSRVGKCMNWQK